MAPSVSYLKEKTLMNKSVSIEAKILQNLKSVITVVQTLWEPSLHLEFGSCLQGSQYRRHILLLYTALLQGFQHILYLHVTTGKFWHFLSEAALQVSWGILVHTESFTCSGKYIS